MKPAHSRRRLDDASRLARAQRWLRRCRSGGLLYHDAADPPPEEHSFALGPGESLAQLRFSPHGYDFWVAFHNPASGPTKLEARGPFDPAPVQRNLDLRLPIEAAIAWAAEHDYDLNSRPDARYATLLLTADDARQDLQVIYFRASPAAHAEDPVNRLLDAALQPLA